MTAEAKTGLTLWDDGILQPDLLFNALLYYTAAWAQAVILSFENAPPGSPDDGDMHLVGTGSGLFTGHDDELAYWDDVAGVWVFFVAAEGYEVHNLDDATDYRFTSGTWTAGGGGGAATVVPIGIACSDETTALTTGAAKVTFRMPYAFTLTAVRASVTTPPTGSVLTVDINEGGATILSTKITIDASEKTSTTAATPPVISDTSLADDAEITIDIDTVGSTVAGAGLKVWLIGSKT